MTGVLIMGAGSVGCFVGDLTQLAGVPVHFVGRPRVLAHLRKHGLRLTDQDGLDRHIPPLQLRLHEEPPAGQKPDLVLLCVKSGATAEAATALALTLPEHTAVVSLQNGIGNAVHARSVAPQLHWPKARSSMADDLGAGRTTEIDALCGEVVRLAKSLHRTAPLNVRMQALVEAQPKRRRPYSPSELVQALGLS